MSLGAVILPLEMSPGCSKPPSHSAMTFLPGLSPACHHGNQETPSTQQHIRSLHGVHHSPHIPHSFPTLPIQVQSQLGMHLLCKHPYDPSASPHKQSLFDIKGTLCATLVCQPPVSAFLLGISQPSLEGAGVGKGTQLHSEALAGSSGDGGSSSFHPNCISPSMNHSPPPLLPTPVSHPLAMSGSLEGHRQEMMKLGVK